jgi:hypothetical protein
MKRIVIVGLLSLGGAALAGPRLFVPNHGPTAPNQGGTWSEPLKVDTQRLSDSGISHKMGSEGKADATNAQSRIEVGSGTRPCCSTRGI